MHRPVSSPLSGGGSPGKLAELGIALGNARISIRSIGGAEWKHVGPIVFVLHEDKGSDPDQIERLAAVMAGIELPWAIFRNVEVELEDRAGQLGAAGAALGDADPPINIYTLEVTGRRGNNALVGFGLLPGDVRRSLAALTAAGFKAHLSRHPDDPDDDGVTEPPSWWDRWDDRTMGFVELWDNPDVAAGDRRFWELG
jgi:hypothetical protein